jgi:hypothetical protein
VKPLTWRRYLKALDGFRDSDEYAQYLTRLQSSIGRAGHAERRRRLIDIAATSFIQRSYDEQSCGRQRLVCLLSGLAIVQPALSGHLPMARRALAGWGREAPPQAAVPLTTLLMWAVAGDLVERGRWHAAGCLILQHGAYLRASEALAVRSDFVALPGDARLADHPDRPWGIDIRDAKTGRQQTVVLVKPDVRQVLQLLLAHSSSPAADTTGGTVQPSSQTIFRDLDYHTYNRAVKESATRLGIPHVTTHSARIGGAVVDFLGGVPTATIALTGRWASHASLSRYLTNGRAWLLRLRFTREQTSKLRAMRAVGRCAFGLST